MLLEILWWASLQRFLNTTSSVFGLSLIMEQGISASGYSYCISLRTDMWYSNVVVKFFIGVIGT